MYQLSSAVLVHLAVPDFGSGAMENWGLILYSEKALLFDPSTGTAARKQRVVEIIAHELAHQVCVCVRECVRASVRMRARVYARRCLPYTSIYVNRYLHTLLRPVF